MANKFKEMLKGFGESIVNYADEMDETENIELSKAEETGTEETKETTEEPKSSKDGVLSEENSFEEITNKVRFAIEEKYFTDEEGVKSYVGIALTFSDAVVIQDWDNEKYYKCDYSIDGDTVTLGELQEVELKYVVKGTEEETPAEPAATEEAAPEAEKSKQPKIKVPKIKINEAKLEDVELEKGNEEKTNHLGFPIKSTKELASRNSFNF